MLVLSRQRNEKIRIGDEIEVVIVDICGDKCRVGVEAPKNISIHRQEVWDAIHRGKDNAQQNPDGEQKIQQTDGQI